MRKLLLRYSGEEPLEGWILSHHSTLQVSAANTLRGSHCCTAAVPKFSEGSHVRAAQLACITDDQVSYLRDNKNTPHAICSTCYYLYLQNGCLIIDGLHAFSCLSYASWFVASSIPVSFVFCLLFFSFHVQFHVYVNWFHCLLTLACVLCTVNKISTCICIRLILYFQKVFQEFMAFCFYLFSDDLDESVLCLNESWLSHEPNHFGPNMLISLKL